MDNLHAFMQNVVCRPAILVGHSLGGFVAAWYASYYPDWVLALIDEDTSLLDSAGMAVPVWARTRDTLMQLKAKGTSLEEFEGICAQDIYRDNRTRLELFGWVRCVGTRDNDGRWIPQRLTHSSMGHSLMAMIRK
jgi:pimeloyl-ACP methyl ester carboxylesterase